jgi:hypothetical protein
MDRRLFGVVPLLLAVGWLLSAAAGLHAQEGKPAEGKPAEGKSAETAADLAKRNQIVRDFLYEVIEKGRVIYNKNRDYFGCYRIYHNALVAVLPLLDHRPDLQKAAVAALSKAERGSVAWQQAFALRKAMDQLRSATANGDKKPPDKDGEDKTKPNGKKTEKDKTPPDPDKDGEKKKPDDKDGEKKKPDDPEKDKVEKKGKPPVPEGAMLTGTVTFNGKALGSGFVTLVSKDGKKSSASIKTDGTYAFRKITPPPGTYRIVIEDSVTLAKGQPPPVALPQRYRSAETSGLTVMLNRGENEFDIELMDK